MQTEVDVVLVSMPFGPLRLPSIGLGLLKSALDRDGVSARTFYFTFDFAERIGERLYSQISYGTNTTDLVGEWIFSDSLFHHHTDENVANYVEDILRDRAQDKNHVWHEERFSDDFIREILDVRQHTEAFLEDCVTKILARRPKIVGFTSIFLQQVASLSLAKRLKARCPELTIVFGGANCEGEMGREVIRQFPFVDAVVSGEADLSFPELVRRVLNDEPFANLPSVFTQNVSSTTGDIVNTGKENQSVASFPRDPRGSNFSLHQKTSGQTTKSAAVENLDALPYPHYDEYFDQLRATSFHAALEPNLLLETARGCWWGAKHHCTFCGLNGETMAFRAKSAERALDEFTTVTAKYPGYPIYVVDNILNLAYFKDLLPQLAERKLGLDLFFEVKANLKKEQLRQLRAAGVTIIQPGIESLSDEVLQIMRKGVKALQNIQLLKWCKEIGITPEWNILWGFPGESPEEYFRLARMLPLLAHLQPPNYALSMRLDRFSPNFNQHTELGFKDLKPFPAYNYVYQLPPEAVANLAYYFTFEYAEPRDVESYVRPVAEEVARWKQAYETSDLFMLEQSGRLLLWDSRPTAKRRLTALTDKEKFLYLACDQVSTARQIADAWSKHSGWPFNQANLEDIRQTLDEFVEAGLMLRQGDSYLALAVARSR
ncbi:MAG: RiPP maturation radical SAM C-methyltransferase [Acidobacteriota bacterium]|nr:RiPP maturation radical SAM C-methyltransferase [Acidobacteriota bacterium]